VSALGESLVNGTYRLGLTTDLTPQWQVGTNLTYRSVDYGTTVFVPPLNILPELIRRKDNYWEGGLSVTYLYSQRVSASLNYTYRGNQSNIPAAEFNDNILGLMLGLRY
jgi:predicted porin